MTTTPTTQAQNSAELDKLADDAISAAMHLAACEYENAQNRGKGGPGTEEKVERAQVATVSAIRALARRATAPHAGSAAPTEAEKCRYCGGDGEHYQGPSQYRDCEACEGSGKASRRAAAPVSGGELVDELNRCAEFIENIKPEELDLWRAVKVGDIRRAIRHAAVSASQAAPVGGGELLAALRKYGTHLHTCECVDGGEIDPSLEEYCDCGLSAILEANPDRAAVSASQAAPVGGEGK